MAKFYGTPDGVHVGQLFIDRAELSESFVHRPTQGGIHGNKTEGADSIVVSGGYIDDQDHGNFIFYTGHGGKDPNSRRQIADQSPDAPGNAGLITSMVQGLPVRVIRGKHPGSPFAPPNGYLYSGLYLVASWWMERGRDGYQIVRFRLDRLDDQVPLEPRGALQPEIEFATTTVTRRIRESRLSREIKELYRNECQLCGTAVPGFEERTYAEGAHVKPLGRPHLGPDAADNILCLCPNHHTQLDIGGMMISDDMVALDATSSTPIAPLQFRKSHRIEVSNVRYHRTWWLPRDAESDHATATGAARRIG